MVKDILPEMNIGLIGHVDHGKTTLTAALSGKWTDTHSQEVKRGITIKLGYADIAIRKCSGCKGSQAYTTNELCGCGAKTKIMRKISFIDAPGHETLMAVMISGAAIMDGALLLVAANDPCPQPQTREHLTVLKILGIKKIIIVQNKIDLVSPKDAEKNYQQIKSFAKEVLGFDVPIIPISAQKKVNLDLLIEAMQEFFTAPTRPAGDPELLVARSFDINKPGTEVSNLLGGIIGGSITSGNLKVDQAIEIRPGLKEESKGIETWTPVKTKITSIVSGGANVKEKGPGGSVAISTTLDPSRTRGDAFVGNLIGSPGKLPPTLSALELKVSLFNKVLGIKENIKIEPLKMNEPLMISAGTATTLGIVTQPGDKAKLNLKKPVTAHKGSKVAISRRVGARWHLIGFGVIT